MSEKVDIHFGAYMHQWHAARASGKSSLKTIVAKCIVDHVTKIDAKARKRRTPAESRRRDRDRAYALREINVLSDADFARMFRVSRERYSTILETIRGDITFDANKATNSSGSAITPETRLYCTLRWLAGGSHHDLCLAYGVARSTVYGADTGIIWPTIHAIDKHYDIVFPTDAVELARLGNEFGRFPGSYMQNCVGALDGLVVRTKAPTEEECAPHAPSR